MNSFRWCTSLLYLWAFIGISTAVSQDVISQKTKERRYFSSHKEYRQFVDKILALKYDYRFVGEIVDPNGKVIPDVSVLSSKSKGPMEKGFGRKTILIKGGKFDFNSKGVFSWGLTFEKSEYYKTTIGMGISNITNGIKENDDSLSIDGNTIIKKMKIILYPYGDLNHELLTVDNSILTYSEGEDNKKIECIVIPYEDKGKRIRKDEEFQFAFSDEKKLPKNLIYIIPGRNKDGSHDGTIRLKTNAKGSGFLPVVYKEGTHCFRSMWEAPKEGYQPELVIEDGLTNYLQHNYVKPVEPKSTGATMRIANAPTLIPKEVSYTVFYFNVMGYYGKGLIMLMDSDSKLERNNASLKIYLYVNRYPGIRNTNIWLGTSW